jgi:hypothetical protein
MMPKNENCHLTVRTFYDRSVGIDGIGIDFLQQWVCNRKRWLWLEEEGICNSEELPVQSSNEGN